MACLETIKGPTAHDWAKASSVLIGLEFVSVIVRSAHASVVYRATRDEGRFEVDKVWIIRRLHVLSVICGWFAVTCSIIANKVNCT